MLVNDAELHKQNIFEEDMLHFGKLKTSTLYPKI